MTKRRKAQAPASPPKLLGNLEEFRGVVWKKGEVAPGLYQYVVVGAIVTDRPVAVGHLGSRHFVAARIDTGISGSLLEILRDRGTSYRAPWFLGDAGDVLSNLKHLDPASCEPEEESGSGI